MYEHGWIRFIVASVLLAGYGAADAIARLAGWRPRAPRAPRVRRPIGLHLLGFASMIVFYTLLARGHALFGGTANQVGVILCLVAMALRLAARSRGAGRVRYPDLSARLLFFCALPLACGTQQSWIGLSLPQAIIVAYEAAQRDAAISASGDAGAYRTAPHRLIPGIW